ncbi:MAG: hypothetical protein K1X74_06135 [Pirellulales bacterium]|nr:hypothetical protein [Pirellulales bacterium]
MSARTKLNTIYTIASIVFAALIASAADSWSVFFVAISILIAALLYDGDIRPKGRQR